MMSTFSPITRAEILKFPFPYKLWIVVHLELCDFLQWNRDGTVILLDLVALEEYLNLSTSIFSVKNRSEFLTQLHEFKFERLNATPEADEDVLLQYKNENFQRHRLDLLAKIRRNTYQLMDDMTTSITNYQNKQMKTKSIGIVSGRIRSSTKLTRVATKLASERMKGDLCFMSHGALSDVQISRFRFQTILNFQHETRILKEKIRMWDERVAKQRRISNVNGATTAATAAAASSINITDPLLEFSTDLYENPHDSAMTFSSGHTRPEYAGYYGNCSKEHLLNFFGDYLPMYEEGSMEIKRISAELIMARNAEALRNLESKKEENLLLGNKALETLVTSTPKTKNTNNDVQFNFSSTLEPIYSNEEENENVIINDSNTTVLTANNNQITNDGISYTIQPTNVYNSTKGIKLSNPQSTNFTDDLVKNYPQMPAAIRMEISEPKENKENDANFRNFFSQYRASLNLIYERH